MTIRLPRANGPNRPMPSRRLAGALKPGTATSNGGVLYEIIPLLGSSKYTVRIKTATNAGTIDVVFVGPDFDPAQTVAFASLVGTKYTTGNPTQVAVTAGTEALITGSCSGENYMLVKFSGTVGAGTITYVDVSLLNA